MAKAYPLRPDLLAMTHVWETAGGRAYRRGKGAPEAIADLCRLGAAERAALAAAVEEMAAAGAARPRRRARLLRRVGFPGFATGFCLRISRTCRPGRSLAAQRPAAVAECRSAGIRVIMITGDYPATALAIARQAGIDADDVATGKEIEELDDAALAARLRTTHASSPASCPIRSCASSRP